MNELLAPYTVVLDQRIVWGEMDAFQHVNNTVYFRYFENARIHYFDKLEMMEEMEKSGIGPILSSTKCRFKIPLTFPDTVSIGVRVSKIEDYRFTTEYLVVSHRLEKVAAEGNGVIVTYDYRNNSKVEIPEKLKQKIKELEK